MGPTPEQSIDSQLRKASPGSGLVSVRPVGVDVVPLSSALGLNLKVPLLSVGHSLSQKRMLHLAGGPKNQGSLQMA